MENIIDFLRKMSDSIDAYLLWKDRKAFKGVFLQNIL